MIRSFPKVVVLLWLVAVLAGCAGLKPQPPGAGVVDTPWVMEGRLALRTPEDGWHASLRWRQEPEGYRILLSGPLGQGALRLAGSEEEVTLRRADGRVSRARDPGMLLYQETGWRLPVTGLRHWVRGRPQPDLAFDAERGPEGRLTRLQQAGWTIEYRDYFATAPAALPRRIALRHGELRAKLIIDQWRALPPDGAPDTDPAP